MRRLFTQHPETVGETYWQHMHSASTFAVKMFIGAFCCLVHALLPFLFEKTGSGIITSLYDRMVLNRHRSSADKPQGPVEHVLDSKA